MMWAVPLLLGYLLGSVPFGVILIRVAGAGDLRAIGSGNIGATNVLRTGRKGLAAATLALDAAKGFLAVFIATRALCGYIPAAGQYAGFAALLGHCFPVWLRFRGGKGVATMLGVTLGLAWWPVGLAFAAVWLGMLALARISSVAGMSAAIATPIVALAGGRADLLIVLTAMAALVLLQHRANINRLIAGEEPGVGQG